MSDLSTRIAIEAMSIDKHQVRTEPCLVLRISPSAWARLRIEADHYMFPNATCPKYPLRSFYGMDVWVDPCMEDGSWEVVVTEPGTRFVEADDE